MCFFIPKVFQPVSKYRFGWSIKCITLQFGLRNMPPLLYLCCASCTLTQSWRFPLLYEQRHLNRNQKGPRSSQLCLRIRVPASHIIIWYVYVFMCTCWVCPLSHYISGCFPYEKMESKQNPRKKPSLVESITTPIPTEPRKDFFRTISRWVWMPTWHLGSLGQVGTRKTENSEVWKRFRGKKIDAVDVWKKHVCSVIDDL